MYGLKRLRKNSIGRAKSIPQRLKPDSFWGGCGTTEVVPFQNRYSKQSFSAAYEARTLHTKLSADRFLLSCSLGPLFPLSPLYVYNRAMSIAIFAIRLLEGMFFVGLVGSAIVVVISFLEDGKELFGKD
jgi:hypothetical protein